MWIVKCVFLKTDSLWQQTRKKKLDKKWGMVYRLKVRLAATNCSKEETKKKLKFFLEHYNTTITLILLLLLCYFYYYYYFKKRRSELLWRQPRWLQSSKMAEVSGLRSRNHFKPSHKKRVVDEGKSLLVLSVQFMKVPPGGEEFVFL